MRFFDTHAHLNLENYDADRDATLVRAREAGVSLILNVGIDAPSSRRARDLARSGEGLFAAAAVHPNSVAEEGREGMAAVEGLLREGGFVAVGETGLDYYRDRAAPDLQRESFTRHLALAAELDLTTIVHCRNAHEDCRAVLAGEAKRRDLTDRVVMHCFGGSAEDAAAYVDLGAWISFSGVVTFPNAHEAREAAAVVPLARTLAETDCPFLAPQAHRGRRNEPAFVAHVVQTLAEVHGVPLSEAARVTTANGIRAFGLHEEKG